MDIFLTFEWIELILYLMLDIGLKFYAVPSQPSHLLTDLEVKVTDLQLFMINEMSITSVRHQKAFIF